MDNKKILLTNQIFFRFILLTVLLISLLGFSSSIKTVQAIDYSWKAYNDVVYRSGQPNTNITQYTIPSEGTSTGFLKNYDTGANTPVTVTISVGGAPGWSGGTTYDGSEPNSGTDAYNTFHDIVDSTGLIIYDSDPGWYVDLTFSGLTNGGSYTFATTANRNDSDYTDRVSRFTISGVDFAENASTQGVQTNGTDGYSVYFSTGYNTVNGYVTRWTGIDPGVDGTFKVRIQAHDNNQAYGPSVFMLAEEASVPTITVVADENQSKVYGSGDPVFTYTYSPPEPSVTFTGALGRATGEDVGTYAINQGDLAAEGYNIVFVPADFNITKRPITVTADDKTKTVGTTDPALTYQITSGSLVSPDTFSGELTREEGETVGTYEIQKGTLALDSNYDLTYVPGTLTITALPVVTVTANAGQTKIYGNVDPVFTYTSSNPGVVFTGALGRETGENVGTYGIDQGNLAAPGYTINFVPADFSITKKTASVTPDAKTKVEGEADPELTGTISGFLEADGVTATYARTVGEAEGMYEISATLSPDEVLGNYDITYNTANFTITPKPMFYIFLPLINK